MFLRSFKKKVTRNKFSFTASSHIAVRIRNILASYNLSYINSSRIFCVESSGSRSRAYARIWGLSRIWQETLGIPSAYILEVTHRFAKLPPQQQEQVLLHELAHIPKNFSGALVGHNGIHARIQRIMNK